MSRMVGVIFCIAAVVVPALASQADPNTPSDPNAVSEPVTLDGVLTMWADGQKEKSLQAFMKIDWSGSSFSADSIFRVSEGQFVKFPEAKRAQVQQQALKVSKDIRELTLFAVDQAKRNGRQAEYRSALLKCAKRLADKDQLALIQMTAKALTGYIEKELKPVQ